MFLNGQDYEKSYCAVMNRSVNLESKILQVLPESGIGFYYHIGIHDPDSAALQCHRGKSHGHSMIPVGFKSQVGGKTGFEGFEFKAGHYISGAGNDDFNAYFFEFVF